jgi:predicted O-methyltransferase YrrM
MQKIIPSKILGRFIYDPWVRSGKLPGKLLLFFILEVNRARLARVDEKHLLQKYKLFEEPATSFSLSRNSLIWLFARLQKSKPESILEMGSGLSTIAHAIYSSQSQKKVRISSIDHDQSWLRVTEAMLQKRFNFGELVDFYHSPIAPEDLGDWGRGYSWPEKLKGPFDWLLIDGPPSQVGRIATLPMAWPFLAQGANVFLDDAERPGEQEAIKKWTTCYGVRLTVNGILPLGKGLLWLTKNE